MSLKDQHCVELKKGTPALGEARIAELLPQLAGWSAEPPSPGQERALRKSFSFPDFVGSMAFINRLATVAEAEQHHPDFSVHYNRVDVSSWTHTVGGLSENDFILAAKLDSLF
jgi:4a-hydroxytetrahydrobiopterin dehydratase